jgi:2-amino-4-hydroxy-6-hydroxymethyldihydropteridine diphosphokinase
MEIDVANKKIDHKLLRTKPPVNINVCYLGLGSNLSNPKSQLERAIAALQKSKMVEVFAVSSFYISKPYGPITDQDDFVNAVVGVYSWHSPFVLLLLCNVIEKAFGRQRLVHWGPRIIDLDLLLYNDSQIKTRNLTIPHPDMQNRDFVMKPLAEVKLI